jgi:hypothetical protein
VLCLGHSNAPETTRPLPAGWRFRLFSGFGFGGFPSLDFRQLPAAAAGGQLDRLGEGRIILYPTAGGQMMHVVSRRQLPVRQISLSHG